MNTEVNSGLEGHVKRVENLKKVENMFPNLKKFIDRWGTVYYSTPEINEMVNEIDFRHSCGCCKDSELFAYFYKVVHGFKVYATPYSINIGKGITPCLDWKMKMRDNRIPLSLEKKYRTVFY